MQKGINIFLGIFLVSLFALAGFKPIGRIYTNEPVFRGEQLDFNVNLLNSLHKRFDDITVRAFFYDLGDVVYANSLDLESRAIKRTNLFFEIPKDASCGEQLVKITAGNSKFRDSKHVFVNIEC